MCWTRNYDGGRVSWEAMKNGGGAASVREGRVVWGPVGVSLQSARGGASEVGSWEARECPWSVVVDVRSSPAYRRRCLTLSAGGEWA